MENHGWMIIFPMRMAWEWSKLNRVYSTLRQTHLLKQDMRRPTTPTTLSWAQVLVIDPPRRGLADRRLRQRLEGGEDSDEMLLQIWCLQGSRLLLS